MQRIRKTVIFNLAFLFIVLAACFSLGNPSQSLAGKADKISSGTDEYVDTVLPSRRGDT